MIYWGPYCSVSSYDQDRARVIYLGDGLGSFLWDGSLLTNERKALETLIIVWFESNDIDIFCEADDRNLRIPREEQTTKKVYGCAHEYYFEASEEQVALFVLCFSEYNPLILVKNPQAIVE